MNKWFIVLISCLCFLHSGRAYANQCYPDAKSAYEALMAQESLANNGKININTATAAELTTLRGVGTKTAQAIVDYRQNFGRFRHIDDLKNVKGIGDKTIENNRDKLTVH